MIVPLCHYVQFSPNHFTHAQNLKLQVCCVYLLHGKSSCFLWMLELIAFASQVEPLHRQHFNFNFNRVLLFLRKTTELSYCTTVITSYWLLFRPNKLQKSHVRAGFKMNLQSIFLHLGLTR